MLRYYQQEAVDAAYKYCQGNPGRNPCIVLPTGAGKTHVIVQICQDVMKWDGRVLVLAHVKELLEQTAGKLRAVDGLDVGVYSASLKQRAIDNDVIVAGVQSVYERALELVGARPFNIVIVDEAHRIPIEGEGMYVKLLNDLKITNPKIRVIGLTATPYRTADGFVCSDEHFLNDVCHEVSIRELIAGKYLSTLVSKRSAVEVDMSGAKVSKGDFVQSEMESRFNEGDNVSQAVDEILKYTADRKKVLIFCCGVGHATNVLEQLKQSGQSVDMVTGATAAGARAETIKNFKHGQTKYLVNVNVLTEGFDATAIDTVVLLRATISPGLYYQMVGRGLRVDPSKDNCIAEGQRVLTDMGLVPIEQVTKEMKVWDGLDFVGHCGIVFRGEKEVIKYQGLEATEDHNVWTKEGWKTFGECSRKQIPIAITGVRGDHVLLSCSCFSTGIQKRREKSSVPNDQMQFVWSRGGKGIRHTEKRYGWMPKMRKETKQRQAVSRRATVAIDAMYFRQAEMHKPIRRSVGKLRRERNRIRVRLSKPNGCLPDARMRNHSGLRDRPNRQRLWIFQRELANSPEKIKHEQSTRIGWDSKNAQVQNALSRRNVCGQHTIRTAQNNVVQASAREIPKEIGQAKRRVWDILNCGPRHRFTCEGLLVSNCLVLDFGGNVQRHGAIDNMKIKAKKVGGADGDAPVKACPECQSMIHAGLLTCPDCGFEFPPAPPNHEGEASNDSPLGGSETVEEYEITDTQYSVHKKRGASDNDPRTMRVTYYEGYQSICDEWVCVEHSGFAFEKAFAWWHMRCSGSQMPNDADEAVAIANSRALLEPNLIKIKRKQGDKFPKIIGYEFGERKPIIEREPGEDDEELEEVVFNYLPEDMPF